MELIASLVPRGTANGGVGYEFRREARSSSDERSRPGGVASSIIPPSFRSESWGDLADSRAVCPIPLHQRKTVGRTFIIYASLENLSTECKPAMDAACRVAQCTRARPVLDPAIGRFAAVSSSCPQIV